MAVGDAANQSPTRTRLIAQIGATFNPSILARAFAFASKLKKWSHPSRRAETK
jgi:hypothetical protein